MLENRRFLIVLVLVVFSLGVASCGEENQITQPGGSEFAARNGMAKGAEADQEFLQWLYYQDSLDPNPDPSHDPESDHVYEDALRGIVSITDGGLITGNPDSWSSDYYFSYRVLPGTIDRSSIRPENIIDGDFVEISIRVPVYDTSFDCEKAAMPLNIGPDKMRYGTKIINGVEVQQKARLIIGYHPLLVPDCDKDWVLGSVEEDTSGVYYSQEINGILNLPNQNMNKLSQIVKPGIQPDPFRDCRMFIEASIAHHSKWALEEDTGPGGTMSNLEFMCGHN